MIPSSLGQTIELFLALIVVVIRRGGERVRVILFLMLSVVLIVRVLGVTLESGILRKSRVLTFIPVIHPLLSGSCRHVTRKFQSGNDRSLLISRG